MRYLIIIISGFLLTVACGEKSTEPENVLVLSDGFERSGGPTHTGWQIEPSLTDFSGDTPEGGGNWSLELTPGNTSEGYAIKQIDVEHGDGIYEFSVWAKMSADQLPETGYVRFGVMRGEVLTQSTTLDFTDTSWTQLSVVDTLTFEPDDQIYMRLSAGSAESPDWFTLFDLVRIEKLPE